MTIRTLETFRRLGLQVLDIIGHMVDRGGQYFGQKIGQRGVYKAFIEPLCQVSFTQLGMTQVPYFRIGYQAREWP